MSRTTRTSSALALCALACGGAPARFETSTAAPKEAALEEPLRPYQRPARYLPHPTSEAELAVDKFLLALENGTFEGLEELLAPGATLREETSGSGNSALPALVALARSWSGAVSDSESPSDGAPAAPFGPARVVEINPHSTDAWATVFVAGPPEVEGYWKLHLETRAGEQQIQEVIVPKNH